jgi:hypothetical protein
MTDALLSKKSPTADTPNFIIPIPFPILDEATPPH